MTGRPVADPGLRPAAGHRYGLPDDRGLNTPSPLSLPYALDQFRPALEAAAAK
ncbi:hypothetical protein [Saccharopolyspora endophytica]|uniref:Uncharacterized protein n=1 Tax=Saccharopolyspora endophytica TaxID=543886 RepID=A0ABS5DNW1_9PSEU|nr:hypothetical protein [Saccharopolyspora endophytica]MBQ0927900.1 hypothetical protein [Saccharopolyspora endophytica]